MSELGATSFGALINAFDSCVAVKPKEFLSTFRKPGVPRAGSVPCLAVNTF